MSKSVEQTNCYQCEAEIEAEVGDVHPLCFDCQDEHDRWFEAQIMEMN